MHLGNFTLGQVIRFEISGRASTGADSTVTGTPTFTIWRDGNTTQRTSSSGLAATADFDSDTGHVQVSVDTSDNTDAGFYRRASLYTIKVSGLTVDAVAFSVRHTFGIEYSHEPARIVSAATAQGVGTAQMTLAAGTITAYGTLIGAIVKELDGLGQERMIISESSGTDIVGVDANWNPALSGTPRYAIYAGSPSAIDEVTFTWPSGTTIETKVDAIQAKTDNLPGDPASETNVTSVGTALTTVGTNVSSVKAKTDSLTFSVSGQVDANVQSINDAALTGDGDGTAWGPA